MVNEVLCFSLTNNHLFTDGKKKALNKNAFRRQWYYFYIKFVPKITTYNKLNNVSDDYTSRLYLHGKS